MNPSNHQVLWDPALNLRGESLVIAYGRNDGKGYVSDQVVKIYSRLPLEILDRYARLHDLLARATARSEPRETRPFRIVDQLFTHVRTRFLRIGTEYLPASFVTDRMVRELSGDAPVRFAGASEYVRGDTLEDYLRRGLFADAAGQCAHSSHGSVKTHYRAIAGWLMDRTDPSFLTQAERAAYRECVSSVEHVDSAMLSRANVGAGTVPELATLGRLSLQTLALRGCDPILGALGADPIRTLSGKDSTIALPNVKILPSHPETPFVLELLCTDVGSSIETLMRRCDDRWLDRMERELVERGA